MIGGTRIMKRFTTGNRAVIKAKMLRMDELMNEYTTAWFIYYLFTCESNWSETWFWSAAYCTPVMFYFRLQHSIN
jgi:hypothetical protein